MGKLIAVMNSGKTPIYIGDQVVVPGNTRHFDENLVPPYLRPRGAAPEPQPAEPAPPAADAIAEAFGVKPEDDLVARIREAATMIPSVPEDLQAALGRCRTLLEGEQAAEKPRAGVIEALAELQLAIGEALTKAQAASNPSGEPAGFDWHELTKAELQAHLKKRHVKFETDANKERLVELCKLHP